VGFLAAFIGQIISLVIFGLMVAGVMKVFQMAGDMREMKELLRDIKRNTSLGPATSSVTTPAPVAQPAAGGFSPQMTPEELVRAVHAQKFSDDDFPALEPTVLPPNPSAR
jgi:hypothetical protein